MKTLGLLRHAKSDWDDMSLRDFDRGLNDRGRRGAAIMGGHIRAHGVRWELLLASPAERVKRTLDATRLDAPVEWQEHIYLADSDALVEVLRGIGGDPAAVMLVGHNPGLQELIFDLVPGERENALFAEVADKFPTAALAVIDLDIDDWTAIRPGGGRLACFVTPRAISAASD